MWCGAAKMGFLGSLTGSLPGFELPTAPVEPRFTGLKAIFTGGLNDDWVKAEHVRETAERFRLSGADVGERSEEHTSELQSLMRISYAVFCLKKTTTSK